MGTAINHPVLDGVKSSFVIFDIRAVWRPGQSVQCTLLAYRIVECPDVKNYKLRLKSVWHRMLYSCTHMSTVGVKGLYGLWQDISSVVMHERERLQNETKFSKSKQIDTNPWPVDHTLNVNVGHLARLNVSCRRWCK